MGKKYIKIQNLLLPKTKEMEEHFWMFYRGDHLLRDKQDSSYQLKKDGFIELFTYFNAFSLEKWKKYTYIDQAFLRIRAKGVFKVQAFGHYMVGNTIYKELFDERSYHLETESEILIPLPTNTKSQVLGIMINSINSFSFYGGEYIATVDEEKIRDIHISLATVTFKKEDFITKNMRILENEIFYSDEELAHHMDVKVIDNGRTLVEEEWNSDFIHIYPNPNVGGSGGYARGMIESLENSEKKATHVLLMDDDVMVLPESFIRTFNLLRLMREEYQNHFISGAMLFYEQLNIQHEDVGYVHEDGAYGPRKPRMEMHLWDSVIKNEKIYEDKPNMYAGWWYCCVPVSTMDLNRLPLPVFIRGDDVEYSIANHAKFITLNGICIWHMGFTTKFNPVIELYQVHRNSLVIQASSGVTPEVDFIKRIKGLFWMELKRFNYVNCDLLLDAIVDFMKGPEFFMKPEGEKIMKAQSQKQPVMKDLETECPGQFVDLEKIYAREEPMKGLKKLLYVATFNGHLLPKWMLDKEPGIIAYDWFDAPEKQFLKESVLAVNPVNATGVRRYRSRDEFFRLVKRYKAVLDDYKRNFPAVKQRYLDARGTVTSVEFWREYLK